MSEFLRESPDAQEKVHPKTNLLDPATTSLDFLSIKKVNLIFRALNHKLRQQIIRLIDKQGKVSVTEIFVELRLDQSVASQHLAILRRAGLLLTEREGKFMYYKLNQARLEMINQMVVDLLK
jgi:DNA-binding transcriptional ArsR family regulator